MTIRRSHSDGNRRVVVAKEEPKGAVRPSRRKRGQTKGEDAEAPSLEDSRDELDGNDGASQETAAHERANQRMPVASALGGARRSAQGLVGFLRLLGAALLLCGVTASAFYGVYHYAHNSPRFAVRQIVIDGLSRVSHASVLERSGIRTGQNVFAANTDEVGRRILADQWVQEVDVERRLPATVRISVVEREASALAMVGDNLLVVTRQGVPFKRFEAGDPVDLPVITGVSLDEPGRAPAVERRRIAVALEVLRHYERTGMSRTYPIQEVHLTPAGEVVLTVGKQGIALHLGAGPWAKKLAMAERVLGKLQGRKGSPSMIFLDNRAHPERVVVRMR